VSWFEYLTGGVVSMGITFFEKPVPTQPVKKFPVFYVILGLLQNKQRSDKRRLLNVFYSVLYRHTQFSPVPPH
jgi:hypothetical protein